MSYPTLTEIRIAAGTTVFELRNGRVKGTIEQRPVELRGDVFVQATRLEDGCWGYCCGGTAYACAGGLGLPC